MHVLKQWWLIYPLLKMGELFPKYCIVYGINEIILTWELNGKVLILHAYIPQAYARDKSRVFSTVHQDKRSTMHVVAAK